MAKDRVEIACTQCGALRPTDGTQPCPACGGLGGRIVAEVNNTVEVGESKGGWLERRRVYLKKHPGLKWTLAAVSFGSPFLGLVVSGLPGVAIGLGFGAVSWLVGPLAAKTVEEIVKERI